ncbi:hypothetical protein FGO68_gene14293 [Halteria grandinella]|uniref:Uncharacterized protein n=1 Tax=Halteria grandinella TaxID=5974 RepID=A0A8J8T4Q2_HALGN|nr:hypothetical protein FGO68_gene14293 [Halteria grandinella]
MQTQIQHKGDLLQNQNNKLPHLGAVFKLKIKEEDLSNILESGIAIATTNNNNLALGQSYLKTDGGSAAAGHHQILSQVGGNFSDAVREVLPTHIKILNQIQGGIDEDEEDDQSELIMGCTENNSSCSSIDYIQAKPAELRISTQAKQGQREVQVESDQIMVESSEEDIFTKKLQEFHSKLEEIQHQDESLSRYILQNFQICCNLEPIQSCDPSSQQAFNLKSVFEKKLFGVKSGRKQFYNNDSEGRQSEKEVDSKSRIQEMQMSPSNESNLMQQLAHRNLRKAFLNALESVNESEQFYDFAQFPRLFDNQLVLPNSNSALKQFEVAFYNQEGKQSQIQKQSDYPSALSQRVKQSFNRQAQINNSQNLVKQDVQNVQKNRHLHPYLNNLNNHHKVEKTDNRCMLAQLNIEQLKRQLEEAIPGVSIEVGNANFIHLTSNTVNDQLIQISQENQMPLYMHQINNDVQGSTHQQSAPNQVQIIEESFKQEELYASLRINEASRADGIGSIANQNEIESQYQYFTLAKLNDDRGNDLKLPIGGPPLDTVYKHEDFFEGDEDGDFSFIVQTPNDFSIKINEKKTPYTGLSIEKSAMLVNSTEERAVASARVQVEPSGKMHSERFPDEIQCLRAQRGNNQAEKNAFQIYKQKTIVTTNKSSKC